MSVPQAASPEAGDTDRSGRSSRTRRWSGRLATLALGVGLGLLGSNVPGCWVPTRPAVSEEHFGPWLEFRAQGAFPQLVTRERLAFRATMPTPRIAVTNEITESGLGIEVLVTNVNRDFVIPEATADRELLYDAVPLDGHEWLSATSLLVRLNVPPDGTTTLELRDAHPERPFRFFVGSDPEGNFALLERFLADALRERPEFVFLLGDLVQEKAWLFDVYDRLLPDGEVPVYLAIGNHDLVGDRRHPPYEARKEEFRERFGPTRYSFDFRGNRFILLDTAAPYLPNGDTQWLAEALSGEPSGRRFVLTHKPFEDPRLDDPRPGQGHVLEDPVDAARLEEVLAAHPGEVRYYCGHIAGYYAYESKGVPVKIAGSLAFESWLERDEGGSNGYLDVRATPEGLEETRVALDSSTWFETSKVYAHRVAPIWVRLFPGSAAGAGLVLVSGAVLAALLRRKLQSRRLSRQRPPSSGGVSGGR